MKLYVLAVLLTAQFSLAVRTEIRTSSFLSNVNNGDAVVGPDGTKVAVAEAPKADASKANAAIQDGKRPAIVKPPAVVIQQAKPKATDAVVTKEFCIQVIQDVAARQAPYFVDGKFTGECRKELVDQCGDRVCEWAKHYKVAATDCPVCPTSCDAGAPSRAAFFSVNTFPTALNILGTQKFYAAIQKEMQARAADASKTTPKTTAKPADVPQLPKGADAPKTAVTAGFCKQMLQDVIDGKAPYFIEGKFTGESRSELISQCGEHICNWALRVHVAGIPQCGSSACCMPETCKMPKAYLQDVVGKGQLLDIINLVGKDTDFLKNFDPKNPPKAIPAQKETPNLRGPIAIKIAPPAANDPRDKAFKK